jgi:hypothetical protein
MTYRFFEVAVREESWLYCFGKNKIRSIYIEALQTIRIERMINQRILLFRERLRFSRDWVTRIMEVMKLKWTIICMMYA